MKLTRQHRRTARCLWQSALVDGVPDTERLGEIVRSAGRYGRDAEPVLRCLLQRLEIHVRAHQIRAVSADRLSAAQQAQLAGAVRSAEAIEFCVEPSVIGGVRVERGYAVTDMTVARQLELLQARLVTR